MMVDMIDNVMVDMIDDKTDDMMVETIDDMMVDVIGARPNADNQTGYQQQDVPVTIFPGQVGCTLLHPAHPSKQGEQLGQRGRFDIYLFSAVPAFQAQKQPGKVELQGPVGRAVANSLVVVIQGAAVLPPKPAQV
ncbi:MAG: hypothetical protein FRX49_09663 [Trebouxia sp. A1-2]|nr:MAG: hypothetical protein FRX49_09663 [Trebouxia sp. A1-2]